MCNQLLKYSALLFLLFLSFDRVEAQRFHDIINYNDNDYVIFPSPSLYFDSNEDEYLFKGLYSIVDGQLYLNQVIKPNKQFKNTEAWDTLMDMPYQMVPISGSYTLLKIENYNRSLAVLSNSGISADTTYNAIQIRFKKGKLKLQYADLLKTDYYREGYLRLPSNWDFDYRFSITNDKGLVYYDNISYTKSETKDSMVNYELIKSHVALPEGNYTVKIEFEKHSFILKDIEINNGEITDFDYPGWYGDEFYTSTCYSCDLNIFSKFNVSIDLMYGNNQLLQTENSEINTFSAGVKVGGELFLDNWLRTSLVGDYGFHYSFHNINRPDYFVGSIPIKHEYYSHFNYSIGGGTRFYLSKYKNLKSRLFLELGANYNIPFWFRHISMNKSLEFKQSEKWLHKFNDFRAYATFGLSNSIALTAEYRIFDYIKYDRIQVPKIQVGLRILFNDL
jgi:hypothetical protein